MRRGISCTATILFTALTAGCVTTTGSGPTARAISLDEASAFERSLQIREVTVPRLPERMYTQPLNKVEQCKLPTTAEQLARTNFRAFWDGQCKDGYAFGLGRDIAISDTHHLEEIVIHDGAGGAWDSPFVSYDFVNNAVNYVTPSGAYPQGNYFTEAYTTTPQFALDYKLGFRDSGGSTRFASYSPLRTVKAFIYDQQNLVFSPDFSQNRANLA